LGRERRKKEGEGIDYKRKKGSISGEEELRYFVKWKSQGGAPEGLVGMNPLEGNIYGEAITL